MLALHGGVGVSVPTPLLPVPLAQSEFTRDRPGVARICTGGPAPAPPPEPEPAAAAAPASLLSFLSFLSSAATAIALVHRLPVVGPELSELVDVGERAASGDRAGDVMDCAELAGWLGSLLGTEEAAVEVTPEVEPEAAVETVENVVFVEMGVWPGLWTAIWRVTCTGVRCAVCARRLDPGRWCSESDTARLT